MLGRILNRAMLQKVADALNLEGVTRFPKMLDLRDIKAVVDITQQVNASPPAAPIYIERANLSGNFPANTLSVGVPLLGVDDGSSSFAPPTTGGNIATVPGIEARLIGCSANVGYSAPSPPKGRTSFENSLLHF